MNSHEDCRYFYDY